MVRNCQRRGCQRRGISTWKHNKLYGHLIINVFLLKMIRNFLVFVNFNMNLSKNEHLFFNHQTKHDWSVLNKVDTSKLGLRFSWDSIIYFLTHTPVINKRQLFNILNFALSFDRHEYVIFSTCWGHLYNDFLDL